MLDRKIRQENRECGAGNQGEEDVGVQKALRKGRTDARKGETGRGVRGGGGPPAVITVSIRPQDGPHQPAGLMFDRIIRKLSRPVITGAHLARKDFHSLSVANTRTHECTQAGGSSAAGRQVDGVARRRRSCLYLGK